MYESTKHIFDKSFSIIFIIVTFPVLLLSAFLIYAQNPGPIFYSQKRDSYNSKPFKIFKLRTMKLNAGEILEKHLKNNPEVVIEWERYFRLKNDPRVVGVIGNIVRRYSLDEIPQFFNILKGDMSLVGPRPLAMEIWENIDPIVRKEKIKVLPGLTGLWQVSGRSETDIKTMVRIDNLYFKRRSFFLDFWILIRTPTAVFSGRGAY